MNGFPVSQNDVFEIIYLPKQERNEGTISKQACLVSVACSMSSLPFGSLWVQFLFPVNIVSLRLVMKLIKYLLKPFSFQPLIKVGQLSVTVSERMCTEYWLTAWVNPAQVKLR